MAVTELDNLAVVVGRASNETPRQLGLSDVSRLATWMTTMQVTRPDILRATHCYRLLQGLGYALRTPRCKNFHDWSFIVQEIDQFLSHSWHGNSRWKALMLIIVKNGLHAFILGTLAALFMSLLVFFHLAPHIQKLAVSDDYAAEPTSVWSLATGMLVASATLILRRPKQTVFLDNICIDQTSASTKAEGVLNMGAFLRSSKSMLVLWDSSYAERLWCIFELAGFLHSHGFHGESSTRPMQRSLEIRPTSAAPCTVAIAVSLFGGMLALLIIPFNNPIVGGSLFGILAAVGFYVATDLFRGYHRCIDKLQLQLKRFDIQAAQCYCCSVNHVGPDGSDGMICDREILSQCISNWFGSVESFYDCVHSTVFANLLEQLQNRPYPVTWLIGASVPILWGQLDAVAVQLREGNAKMATAYGIQGLMWWLSGFPVSFLCWWAFCRSWRVRTRCDWLVNIMGSCVIIATMSLLWTCELAITSLIQSDVWGSTIFFVFMLPVTYLLWSPLRWPFLKQDPPSQHRHQIS